MTKLKVVIVDDEDDAIAVLKYIIEKYCEDVEIVGSASNAKDAYSLIVAQQPDVLLLDIQIASKESGENSFELLKRLPDFDYQVVFVTAYNKYAVQAIKIHAFDYLLKPVNVEELVKVLHTIKEQNVVNENKNRLNGLIQSISSEKTENNIWLNANSGFRNLLFSEIYYIKSLEKYVEFYLKDEVIFISKSLKEIVELLPSEIFFKPHRSFLVNTNQIKEIIRVDGEIKLSINNTIIPVSRRNKMELLQLLKIE